MHEDVVVIIPARIGSTRLPNKPLELIGDKTMIEHIATRVKDLGLQVYVATDSAKIATLLTKHNLDVVMTDESCPSGTDRVHQALQKLPQLEQINYVINVQGDMPFVDTTAILQVIELLKNSDFEITTPVAKVNESIAKEHSNVKVIIDNNNKALYFSRNLIPYGAKEFLYHIGIYGFRKNTLNKFVALPQTNYEKNENLEQLRALENGMKIGVCHCSEIPISVDTITDLEKAQNQWQTTGQFKSHNQRLQITLE